ncbi:hypothetical protein EAG_14581 [Camponotus floridanus]|uniref:Mevalonate kinase n=1 Tax=Camponotus floridanus TaxID=104421 RepID=E2AW62_CAMFO|nr:hypothetical protein EAG_14581 [Camponotus floridanus]
MEELGVIGASAMYCRKGTRSSMCLLDSSVGLSGNVAIIYQLLGYLHHNRFTFPMPKMRVLLVDSTVRQNKYDQIEYMARLKCLFPEFTDRHLDNINKISRIISNRLHEIVISQRNNNLQALVRQFIILKILVLSNQHVLCKLNLSNQILDDILYISHDYGYDSTGKLTGDGEKKFACILLRPGISEEQIDNISAEMESYDFPVMITSIGCDGVRIED